MRRTFGRWLVFGASFAILVYAVAEEYAITTYYPSPRGVYKELRATGNLSVGQSGTPLARFHVTQTQAEAAMRVDDETSDPTPLVIDQNGRLGIGTASPQSALDVRGEGRFSEGLVLAGDFKVEDIIIDKHGIECIAAEDCDRDGHSYFTGDCDETCATCYVGSTVTTGSPDGKDQNCDGQADNMVGTAGTGTYYGWDATCTQWVPNGKFKWSAGGGCPAGTNQYVYGQYTLAGAGPCNGWYETCVETGTTPPYYATACLGGPPGYQ